jgi:hypothetical protein
VDVVEETRPHDDLDLGVRMTEVADICAALSDFARSDDGWPSSFVRRPPSSATSGMEQRCAECVPTPNLGSGTAVVSAATSDR